MINRTSNLEKLRKDKHNGKTIFKLSGFYNHDYIKSTVIVSEEVRKEIAFSTNQRSSIVMTWLIKLLIKSLRLVV